MNKLKWRRQNLDAKPLDLRDAFRLASVLAKHIDAEKIDPQQDAVDFISDIVDVLSPEEYLHGVMLLTQTDEETIKSFTSIEILTAFIEGLKLNQVVSLLRFYKSLGL